MFAKMDGEIPCSVSPLDFVTVQDERRSGCALLHVAFPAPSKVSKVTFANSYTASLSILGKASTKTGIKSYKWLIRNFVLMPHPHYETASESEFCIDVAQECPVEAESLFEGLLFILRQPSPHWSAFTLRDIRCYGPSEKTPDVQVRSTQVEQVTRREEANKIAAIAGLVDVLHQCKPESRPKTFEVDGSYEINLLSYT